MEMYILNFLNKSVDGETLLQADSTLLKQLGVVSQVDRAKIKDKVKELKKINEKEKKRLKGGKGGGALNFLR